MDACTETFVTLIKFMTSMNWSSDWRRSGMAWDKVSSMMQCISGTNVSGRVFMSTEGILGIMIQEHEDASVYKQIYVTELNTSRELLLLIFCISHSSDIFKVRWEIWHEPYCKFTAESNGERILTRGQSNLTKSASRGADSPVRGHPRGSKVVPLNSWGRVSY